MEKDNLQISKAIDILRFPLAVMVVAIHTYFNEGLKAKGNVDIPFSGEWAHELIRLFSITLTDCAVPMFFAISGYLFFLKTPHLSKDVYIHKIKGKCITLLIPFLCWNIIACFVNPSRFLSVSTIDKITGFWSVNLHLFSGAGPWNGPLWFIRNLFIVMIFSPFIEIIIRRLNLGAILIFLFPLYYGVDSIIPGLSMRSFCFFTVGAYFAVKKINIIEILKGSCVLSVALVFFILRCFSYGELQVFSTYISQIWIFTSMAFYFYIATLIAKRTKNMNRWKKLAASSFIVFAMHRLINSKVSALGLLIIGKPQISGIEAVLLYFCTISITVVVCYFTHVIIKKNKYTSLLLEGSRK